MTVANLKLQSKSFRFYFQLTKSLQPLDVIVTQYLIQHMKLSLGNTLTKGNNYNFYRNDSKIKGIYYEIKNLSLMIKNLPCKTSDSSLKRSLNRLQNKYGFIFKHKTYKGCLQIFMPVLDEAISNCIHNPYYHTAVNMDLINRLKDKLNTNVKNDLITKSKNTNWKGQNDLINTGVKMSPVIQRSKWHQYYKGQNEPSINNRRSNNRKNNNRRSNVVVVSPLKRGATNNDNNNKQQQKLPKWIINNLNKSVANLLVNNVKDVKTVATKIIDIIFSNNRNYYNIMGTNYYRTKTNPYIQDGGLMKSLKTVFNNHKDLKDTITNDYQNYISDNSNLKLKNSKKPKNNGLDYNGNDKTTSDKVRESRNEIDLLNKGKEHAKSTKEKQKIQSKIEKEAHFICNNSDDEMWAIDGTTESHTHLHPTSEAMQRKIKKQLHDLDKHDNDPYIDGNGEEHVTVKHDIFKPKSKPNSIDMDEIESNFEKEDED